MKTIAHHTTRHLLLGIAMILATLHPIASPAADLVKKGKLTHIGLVWLKAAGSEADRQRIIDALQQFAREIPEVQSMTVGKPHASPSKLVDSTFDVCFTLVFDDQAALDRYARHPVHQKAAQEVFLPLSGKILFYDFTSE